MSFRHSRVSWGVLGCPGVQGRHRYLKSGTAIERYRRSARTEGMSGGRTREWGFPTSRKGGYGDFPRENFQI